MSGLLLPGLRHALPRWLNLLARIVGSHGGHFKKGTWLRQPACGGFSGLLKATSAGHQSDQSRSAADAFGRDWTIHVLRSFTSWDKDARSVIGSAACRLTSNCRNEAKATTAVARPLPRLPGLLLPFRFAHCAASQSARSGTKTSPSYLGSRWRTSRSGPKGRYAGSYKVFVAWPLLLESPNWDVSWFQSLIFISPASGITTPLHRLCIFS